MQRRRVLRVLVNHEPIDRPRSSQISSIRGKKNDKIELRTKWKKTFPLNSNKSFRNGKNFSEWNGTIVRL